MIKILSWKINSGVYAYIYPVNDGKYISNRIPEDSPIWKDIIEIMSRDWDENTYRANFDAMNVELESKYGKTIEWSDKYWGLSDENNSGVNIVLLSGKDGVGVAGEGEKTDGDSENIDEFVQEIENKLNKAREEIEKKNEEVENFIEEKVSQTIANAQKTINETKEELSIVREELTEGLNSAKDALKKASDLFDFNGEITQEDIIGAVSTTKEYGGWLEDYSKDLTSLKADYDATAKEMGSIGEAENVSKGLFSKIATSLSVVSGTVGTVESTMNASLGEIKDMATWYDTNKDNATEAIRLISASGAQIQDTINFINGDGLTTHLNTIMDAKNANIKQEILAETDESIGNVKREMNAISGAIEDTIVRLSNETLTSMGDRMNALDFEMEKWMTQFNELCGTTVDMRETWTAQSGMLSTVASLTAELDENGDVKFYVSAGTSGVYDPPIVVKRIDDGNGGFYYLHEDTNTKFTEAYTKLSTQMASYIQQEISGITLSVVNGEGLTAAIKLAIKETPEGDEEPIITMIAKEVVISADLIAGAISAVSANIGGIAIGNGIIESLGNNSNKFKLDGKNGTITANNVSLSGSVYATNGVFSGTVYANAGSFSGNVCATNGIFKGTIQANDGKIGGFELSESTLNVKNGDSIVSYIDGGTTNEEMPMMALGLKKTDEICFYSYVGNIPPGGGTDGANKIYIKEKFIKNGDIVYIYTINSETLNKKTGYYTVSADTSLKHYISFENENYYRLDDRYDLTYAEAKEYGHSEYNTTINSNGIINCNGLNVDNGIFNGLINAGGEFNGNLNVNGGNISNATLTNVNFDGNIIIEDNNLKVYCGNTCYFTVTPQDIAQSGTISYKNVEYKFDVVNTNKDKEYEHYEYNKTIFKTALNSGDTVNIKSITAEVSRYIPQNRDSGAIGWLRLKFLNNNKETTKIDLNLQKKVHGSDYVSGSAKETTFTASSDCYFSIILNYSVMLPKPSWSGADKATCHINVFNTGKITVTSGGKINKGFTIAPNGFVFYDEFQHKIGDGGATSIKRCGVQVMDGDIKIFSNGEWVEFSNYIKSVK